MKELVLPFSDEKGEKLDITFSEMTLADNREFAAKCRARVLQEAENIARVFPALSGSVESIVRDVCVTSCEIPSPSGLTYAFSREGTEQLIKILTRRIHPTPVDDETLKRLMQDKFSEVHSIIRELIPIPKVTGPTSGTQK